MANPSPAAVTTFLASAAAAAACFLVIGAPTTTHAFAAPGVRPRRPPAPAAAAASRLLSRPTQSTNTALSMAPPRLNIFGDMASSFLSSGGGGSANAQIDAAISATVSSSWDDVRAKLEAMQTDDERAFRSNLAKGYGAASPLHLVRLYDSSNTEADIRVTFYRDHASWCPYCHKVWMSLEEKRIPYRVEKINMRCYGEKPLSFQMLQPSGAIPVAKIDGTVYNQSNDIIFALEELFPDHKALSPSDDKGRERAQRLLRLEREIFSLWMAWLTGGYQRDGFLAVLGKVEAELRASTGGDFFMGEEVTLVDFMFAPFLERMAASLLYYKGFQMRVGQGVDTDYPALNKWFDAMETLESYRLTKSDYYTHNWDLPPQLGGCRSEEDGKPFEGAINGERSLDGTQGSWELPLQKDNGGVEPDWDWCGDEEAALREAAERLSFNHANIVKFAARGAGKKGMPPYSAPLSDPNATPNDAVVASVDTALRVVSLAMLEGTAAHEDDMSKLAAAIVKEGGVGLAEDCIKSLGYLRDRVGVPRDMRLPAARQLRAHLNWAIGKMLNQAES